MKRVLAFVVMMPLYGYAGTINVTTTTDGASGSLRSAIATADVAGGNTTINVPAGTYILTMGAIPCGNFAETITIVGAGSGSTIIQMELTGSSRDRIFNIDPNGNVAGVIVDIQGMTLEDGAGNSDNNGGGAIICGGPGNTTTLQDCIFLHNSDFPSSTGGGAVAVEGGGSLIVNNCEFSNNIEPSGIGGAIFYSEPGNQSGALTITGTVFSGNSATSSTASGGAINIAAQGNSGGFTSGISIQQCTFIGNFIGSSVTSPAGLGGAISIDNAFATGNTATINYNRFYANIAASVPDVLVGGAQGNVDVTNNWWGRNAQPAGGSDPHAVLESGGTGTMTYNPWLELKTSSAAGSLCAGSGTSAVTVTAGFFSGASAAPTADLGALTGLSVSFSATLGSLSSASGTISGSGTATDNFTPMAGSGSADIQVVLDSVPVSDAVAAANITLTGPVALPAGSASGTIVIGGSEPVTDASCEEIASIAASGSSPVSGSVTVGVTIDPSVQSANGEPYLTRHYDITPVSNASTATATITLYFLQSEFNAYNAVVNNPAVSLPTSSTDATGMANLTITQFHGSGAAPGNYSGWTGPGPASVLISPGSSNVVWNGAKNWWEVSFPVTGFSGFYVTGPLTVPLPVTLERFSGVLQGTGVLLNWQVADEVSLARYEVQGAVDGVDFSLLGAVAAAGASGAGASGAAGAFGAAGAGAYQYFVSNPSMGENYYRLKMVNEDGTFTYSPVVVVDVTSGGRGVVVLSNPFTTSCVLRVTAVSSGPVSLRLADMSGKVLWVSSMSLVEGVNTFTLPRTEGLAAGVYLLSLVGGQMHGTVKVVKE